MDYEKKYKEAMEKVRSLHDNADEVSKLIDLKEELEAIFPELAESEGEKIRKWLIRLISTAGYRELVSDKMPYSRTNVIAWLEKQGEQKPYASETMNEKGDFDNGFTRMMEKEQKSAWSEEDENRLNHIIQFLEDKDRWKDTERAFPIEEDVRWLKSLKERVQPQPKQEWGEEDEEMIDSIIGNIKYLYSIGSCDNATVDKKVNWLKSLSPQSHWKPSDEQMEALKEQCVNLKSTHSGSILCELYDKLKKL